LTLWHVIALEPGDLLMTRLTTIVAICAAMASPAMAQAPAAVPAPAEIPIALPDTKRIESFANGDIRHSPASDTYFFVVQASDKAGQFWLQCEKRGPFTIAIAMVGGGEQRQRSQRITVQADQSAPRRMDFVVFDNFVAIASRHEGKPDENASIFMEALNAAKKTFTVSYPGSSHDFDVGPMEAPRGRFLARCRQHNP
jgi:hypothetical protein